MITINHIFLFKFVPLTSHYFLFWKLCRSLSFIIIHKLILIIHRIHPLLHFFYPIAFSLVLQLQINITTEKGMQFQITIHHIAYSFYNLVSTIKDGIQLGSYATIIPHGHHTHIFYKFLKIKMTLEQWKVKGCNFLQFVSIVSSWVLAFRRSINMFSQILLRCHLLNKFNIHISSKSKITLILGCHLHIILKSLFFTFHKV